MVLQLRGTWKQHTDKTDDDRFLGKIKPNVDDMPSKTSVHNHN